MHDITDLSAWERLFKNCMEATWRHGRKEDGEGSKVICKD